MMCAYTADTRSQAPLRRQMPGHFISERAVGVQSMQLSLSLGSCLLTGPAREIRWWTRWWINFGADPWPGQLMGPDCGSHGADNRDRCWPDWHGCQPDVDGSTIEGFLTDADQTWEDGQRKINGPDGIWFILVLVFSLSGVVVGRANVNNDKVLRLFTSDGSL